MTNDEFGWLWRPEEVNVQRALAGMLADAPGLSEELRAVYREWRGCWRERGKGERESGRKGAPLLPFSLSPFLPFILTAPTRRR